MVVNCEIEVAINASDVESELKFLKNALVMYLIGENLYMNVVKTFMINI